MRLARKPFVFFKTSRDSCRGFSDPNTESTRRSKRNLSSTDTRSRSLPGLCIYLTVGQLEAYTWRTILHNIPFCPGNAEGWGPSGLWGCSEWASSVQPAMCYKLLLRDRCCMINGLQVKSTVTCALCKAERPGVSMLPYRLEPSRVYR